MHRRSPFLLVPLLLVTMIMAGASVIHASADDITIAPASGTTRGVDSGLEDDNGNPISEADYQKMVEKSKENIVQRDPVGTTIVVTVIIAGVAGVVLLKRSKRAKF